MFLRARQPLASLGVWLGKSPFLLEVRRNFPKAKPRQTLGLPGLALKMERAKRLELNAENPEATDQISVVNSANAVDTQLSTHAAELVEIAAAWPGLSREIQTAVLTLIRVAGPKTKSI
jgi:hypothetical protein